MAQLSRGPIYDSLLELSRLAVRVADSLESQIDQAAQRVMECLANGNKVLVCGNGGSAADAQHFAAELIGKMARERRALPAMSLAVDPSTVTALGNDYGFDSVFARQVEGLGRAGDVLLVISTSGRSANILKALETARRGGLHTIALVGEGGEPSVDMCDVCIHVPSPNSQRVQELHTAILHLICAHVESRI